MPLSDAASNLGVCTSVLKKICRDNGLVRWPYRKVLSGTSIEEIKKEAARERNKQLIELSKAARQSGASASSAVSSTFGSQLQNKISNSEQDMSKSQGVTMPHNLQQQGNKNIQNGSAQNVLKPSLTKTLDEFKYGFPSDSLSTLCYKWWGSDGYESFCEDGAETDEEDRHKSEELADDGAKPETGKEENNIDSQGTGLLRAVRKRAAEEGREALEIGAFKGYGVNKLGKRERTLLLRIFKSSLSSQWLYGSS